MCTLSVCVCVCERERDGRRKQMAKEMNIVNVYMSDREYYEGERR